MPVNMVPAERSSVPDISYGTAIFQMARPLEIPLDRGRSDPTALGNRATVSPQLKRRLRGKFPPVCLLPVPEILYPRL
jgi:hypothetical protein